MRRLVFAAVGLSCLLGLALSAPLLDEHKVRAKRSYSFSYGGGGRKSRTKKVVHIIDCHGSHDCHGDDDHHVSFGHDYHDYHGGDYHDDHGDYHDYHDDHHDTHYSYDDHDYHHDYHDDHGDYHDDYHDYHDDYHDDHHGGGGYGKKNKYKIQKPKIVIIKKIISRSTTTVPSNA